MDEIEFLKREDVRQFIFENRNSDVNRIILSPPSVFKNEASILAKQILARQKAKGKLDEWLKNEHLLFPQPLSVEQSSSTATARYKRDLLSGEHVVDLTGGMGVDLISLSQSFEKATYVEMQPSVCAYFRHNAAILGHEVEIVNDEAENYIRDFQGTACFYVDPARRDQDKNKVFKLEDCTPDVIALIPQLKSKSDQLLIKLSPMIDLSSVRKEIPNIKEIHVVSVRNECKEVLLLIDFEFENEPTIIAVNLETDQPSFAFKPSDEGAHEEVTGGLNTLIYEPNASILKAGAFKTISKKYGLTKLAQHTHLYTSKEKKVDFPGRVFRVISSDVKKTLPNFLENGAINVITRNYPLPANELKKKMKIKDGGAYFLLGYRDVANKPHLVIAEKIKP
ncbi:MAG: hypothetical protein Tsb0034_28170 [Ekhidna sp.]